MPGVGEELIPVVPPDGSIATDWAYPLGVGLTSQLSDSAKSDLLAVTNIGSAITKVIEKALEKIDELSDFTTFLLDGSQLNNLTNGSSVSYTVSNTGDSPLMRLVIILGSITPAFGGKIVVDNGIDAYELPLSTATSVKRIEFNALSPSFVSSFTITNNTGVSLASSANSLVVVGL
jgi:hypothetical protein